MKHNVLIVEDSAEVRTGMKIALESQGYEVQTAADGREGIKRFRERRPDIALLDIRMPRMSGIDVCTLIRHESDIPVIMFSGVDEAADVKLALQRGANDYVLKDTGFKELLSRVAKHLKLRVADVLMSPVAGAGAGRLLPFSSSASGSHSLAVGAGKSANANSPGISTGKVAASVSASTAPGGALENLVVVAHSDPEAMTEIAEIAGRTNFEVAKATTGREAVEVLALRRPKLLVIGNVLTDMNCLTVVQAVTNHPLGELMGVVLALGRRSPELARRARYMGVQETVVSPWNDGRLDLAIRSALAATRAARSRLEAA